MKKSAFLSMWLVLFCSMVFGQSEPESVFSHGGTWTYKLRFLNSEGKVTDQGKVILRIPQADRRDATGQIPIQWTIDLEKDNKAIYTHSEYAVDKQAQAHKYLSNLVGTVTLTSDSLVSIDSLSVVVPKDMRRFIDSIGRLEFAPEQMEPGLPQSMPNMMPSANYFLVKPPRTGKLLFTQLAPFPYADDEIFKNAPQGGLLSREQGWISYPGLYNGNVGTEYTMVEIRRYRRLTSLLHIAIASKVWLSRRRETIGSGIIMLLRQVL